MPIDTAPDEGPAQAGRGVLHNRTIAIGSGENNRTAHAACADIRPLLGGLSNMLMAAMLSPVTRLNSVHSHRINPCSGDPDSAGPQRPACALRLSSLE